MVGLHVILRGHLWLALENVVDGPKIQRVEDEGHDDHDDHKLDLGPGTERRQQPHSGLAELWKKRGGVGVGEDAGCCSGAPREANTKRTTTIILPMMHTKTHRKNLGGELKTPWCVVGGEAAGARRTA